MAILTNSGICPCRPIKGLARASEWNRAQSSGFSGLGKQLECRHGGQSPETRQAWSQPRQQSETRTPLHGEEAGHDLASDLRRQARRGQQSPEDRDVYQGPAIGSLAVSLAPRSGSATRVSTVRLGADVRSRQPLGDQHSTNILSCRSQHRAQVWRPSIQQMCKFADNAISGCTDRCRDTQTSMTWVPIRWIKKFEAPRLGQLGAYRAEHDAGAQNTKGLGDEQNNLHGQDNLRTYCLHAIWRRRFGTNSPRFLAGRNDYSDA